MIFCFQYHNLIIIISLIIIFFFKTNDFNDMKATNLIFAQLKQRTKKKYKKSKKITQKLFFLLFSEIACCFFY